MKTLQKKIIGITTALLFAFSGSSAYALTDAEIQSQLSAINQIVAIVAANPEYRSFIPTVISLVQNLAEEINDNDASETSMPAPSDFDFEFADITDLDFGLDDDELVITIMATTGDGCARIEDADVEQEEDDVFSITVLEKNLVDERDCDAAGDEFEQEVVIDLEDLDEDTYTVLVNDEEEFEFEITDGESEEVSNSNEANDVETSAMRVSQDGSNNDYAEYEVEFSIEAFGDESFISEIAEDSVNFEIMDGGTVVYDSDGAQQGTVLISIDSSADLDDGFYRLSEGTPEEFSIRVTYDPYGGTAAGNGSYRLQIESLEYASEPGESTFEFKTNPQNDFRTSSVQIVD